MRVEQVLVFKREIANDYLNEEGSSLITKEKDQIVRIITENYTFIPRDEAEYDFAYKQVIPYIVITYNGQYLLLKRTTKQTEKRLHNKASLGIGGHINPSTDADVIMAGLEKELHEEVWLEKEKSRQFIGIINNETSDVSRVHLGLLYVIELDSPNFKILESDKMSGQWVTMEELRASFADLEGWSKIVVNELLGITD